MATEMTDWEMLEFAANASGMCISSHIGARYDYFADEITGKEWNPLTDDGDALRLAVKKQLFTEQHALFIKFLHEELSQDKRPSEATRRAIVRAAAAIGKAMP